MPRPRYDADGWTLAAYIEHNEKLREVQQEHEQRVEGLRQEIQRLRDQALRLQAAEYERRLEGLNHENARISAAAMRAVSAEKFDLTIKPIEDFVTSLRGRGAGVDLSRTWIAWAVALLLGLITLGTWMFADRPPVAPPAPQVIYVPAAPGTLIPSPAPGESK